MNLLKRLGADLVRVAFAAVLLAGIGTASGQVYKWTTTPGPNATSDPSVNWAEGMAPSAVNDSARAMMSSVAKYRDDISGLITTTGTGSAYVIATNQGGLQTAPVGTQIAIRPHSTNAAGATLAVDGGSAAPIQSRSGVAIGAGVLVAGSPYTLIKDDFGGWLVRDFHGAPFEIPLGGIIDYTAGASPNSNFIVPEGQCISRTTYATYFALISTYYGACDGSTTFAVIDMRGRVAAGEDNGAGRMTNASSGCSVAFVRGATCGSQSRTLDVAHLPPHTHTGVTDVNNSLHVHGWNAPTDRNALAGDAGSLSNQYWRGSTTQNTDVENQRHTHNFTTNSTGSGAAFAIVQPTIAVTKLLRVM